MYFSYVFVCVKHITTESSHQDRQPRKRQVSSGQLTACPSSLLISVNRFTILFHYSDHCGWLIPIYASPGCPWLINQAAGSGDVAQISCTCQCSGRATPAAKVGTIDRGKKESSGAWSPYSAAESTRNVSLWHIPCGAFRWRGIDKLPPLQRKFDRDQTYFEFNLEPRIHTILCGYIIKTSVRMWSWLLSVLQATKPSATTTWSWSFLALGPGIVPPSIV